LHYRSPRILLVACPVIVVCSASSASTMLFIGLRFPFESDLATPIREISPLELRIDGLEDWPGCFLLA